MVTNNYQISLTYHSKDLFLIHTTSPVRARWRLCSLLSARNPGWWRNHHNACFHDHFIFTWQVVHKLSSRKRQSTVLHISLAKTNHMAAPKFSWRGDIYSYIWRRKETENGGPALETPPTREKSLFSWSLFSWSLCSVEDGDWQNKNRNKTLLDNKWDQFQNLINVMERIKQGEVIEWWGGCIWLVVREELSEKVASELGDEWQEPTMRWSWDRVFQRDPKITIFCCT